MATYGFHASHEQVHPAALLEAVQLAEQVGFDFGMSSDHFSPWSERQGHSGFAWTWLGAAMATTSLPFGVVHAPGQRYHPAVSAQMIATTAAMAPGRLWVALGTGEASNEHVTGDRWPRKDVRNARLRECVDVIRRLHAGEEVSHDGLVVVDRARVWTLPPEPVPLVAAAVTPQTSAWAAEWADGYVTVLQPHEGLRDSLAAYRDAGGRGPARLQVHVSWHPSEQEALRIAHEQWRTNVFPPPVCWDLETPAHFDAAAVHVQPEQLRGPVLVSSDLGRFAGWLHELAEIGFEEVALHHVGVEQRPWLEAFGESVLPQLRGSGSPVMASSAAAASGVGASGA